MKPLSGHIQDLLGNVHYSDETKNAVLFGYIYRKEAEKQIEGTRVHFCVGEISQILLWLGKLISMTCIARSIPCKEFMRLPKLLPSDLSHQTSFSNLGRVFYSLDEGGYDSQKLSSNSIATLNLET